MGIAIPDQRKVRTLGINAAGAIGSRNGAITVPVGPDDKIYPVLKIASVVGSLQAEGIAADQALDKVNLTDSDLTSPATRVSLNQVIQSCRNAIRLSNDPYFAYHAGLRFHVSTFGMYGFAMLSSPNFRQTIQFSLRYRQLATPLTDISFREEGGNGVWTIVPVPHPNVDAALYRFLVDMQFGIQTSLFRDIMGPSFGPRRLRATFGPSAGSLEYRKLFGCPVVFRQAENEFLFDAKWLDGTPELGNEITYRSVLSLCDQLMDELQLRVGLVGKVREAILHNLARPRSLHAVAEHLKMSPRTLRRKLRDENSTFREIMDDLRMRVAIKYLRDTDLTIEEIAAALGFSDAANFGHAFRRWAQGTPKEFRRAAAA
jgi:AraC-like DNA-binding protein